MSISRLHISRSNNIRCPRTGSSRCYCQPGPNVQTSYPLRTSGEAMPDRLEKSSGWPAYVGAKGYAGFLLGLSNPQEGDDGDDGSGEEVEKEEGEWYRFATMGEPLYYLADPVFTSTVPSSSVSSAASASASASASSSMSSESQSSSSATLSPTPPKRKLPANEEYQIRSPPAPKRKFRSIGRGGGAMAQAKSWKGRSTPLPCFEHVEVLVLRDPASDVKKMVTAEAVEPRVESISSLDGVVLEQHAEGEGDGICRDGANEMEETEVVKKVKKWRRVIGVLGCGARV